MAREILAVDSVVKSFRGHEVLKAASFWAKEGRVTTLLGRNGSGKSTLLRIAVGEVRAETGVVRFLSEAYTRPRLPVLARRGLYYLEERGRLPSTFPVAKQLRFILKRFGGQEFDQVVDLLELENCLGMRSDRLSGGEARRAALAGALLREPLCLLVDEPFAGITPKDQEAVGSALRNLAAAGTAVVTTGHDVAPLLNTADEVIWCVAGTTHGLGRPEEARSHAQFRREYLGVAEGLSET
jgi:ABC-2 type transport system ATP-binding protein